ncbi:lipase family alpha/beta hydrolase [Marinobacter xestospongiae]|uniref:Triacylglycerol lipase n=1 Tax=Marinobacter xestospongiae TaxID=994319 RepID=A0ABU3VUJ3_9GAMM|nr:triacylglycerol lipase [Marinobacter xestospongiae]MDV2077938.1 triacylglycerol lipase [Marinobacter xestospongiae]
MNKLCSSLLLNTAIGLVAPATTMAAGSISICSVSGCSETASPWGWSRYADTRYPIVLAHGMAGFSRVGPLDYWYQIPQDLARNGADVFITQVASFESSEVRGEQLLRQVEDILAITGADRVNLIGHSHGSHSIRYVAGVAPDLVASATAIGGPNTGSPVADLVDDLRTSEVGDALELGPVLSSVLNGFFGLVGLLSGEAYEQDALAGLASLTTEGAADFNARFPAGMPALNDPCGQGAAETNGVRYYSWSGTRTLTNVADVSDYALSLTSLAFNGEANDGLVGRCSSHLGTVIRDNYRMNHLDEVNQMIGLTYLFETNPKSVFRVHANRLKQAGL